MSTLLNESKVPPSSTLPTPPNTPKDSPFLFIGRPCCPPFVFRSDTRLTRTNMEWLKTSDLNELEYLEEKAIEEVRSREGLKRLREGERVVVDLTMSDDESEVPSKRAKKNDRKGGRAVRRGQGLSSWTIAEERALWVGQLKYGEGRDWPRVLQMVNKAGLGRKALTDCQEKWHDLKEEAFGG